MRAYRVKDYFIMVEQRIELKEGEEEEMRWLTSKKDVNGGLFVEVVVGDPPTS